MIEPEELRAASVEWGVPVGQIARDHVISHILAALAGVGGIVFFGGTALNRTFLDDRLSEDIDLYLTGAVDRPNEMVLDQIRMRTRREFPSLEVVPAGQRGDVTTYRLEEDEVGIRIQVVARRYENSFYPVTPRPVRLRYSDLPADVVLPVPTLAAFAAMKIGAFADRATVRDLFDLVGLARMGAISAEAISLVKQVRGAAPQPQEFANSRCPDITEWSAELENQVADIGDPGEMLAEVRDAIFPAQQDA